jgi:hypothetical protein
MTSRAHKEKAIRMYKREAVEEVMRSEMSCLEGNSFRWLTDEAVDELWKKLKQAARRSKTNPRPEQAMMK